MDHRAFFPQPFTFIALIHQKSFNSHRDTPVILEWCSSNSPTCYINHSATRHSTCPHNKEVLVSFRSFTPINISCIEHQLFMLPLENVNKNQTNHFLLKLLGDLNTCVCQLFTISSLPKIAIFYFSKILFSFIYLFKHCIGMVVLFLLSLKHKVYVYKVCNVWK